MEVKMWTVTEKRLVFEEKNTLSYGISSGRVEINDISTQKDEICKFVNLLNKMGASEIHAYDLVEDFLGK